MITARAIITLVVFIVSTIFVIIPVSVRVPLRHGHHFSIPMNLVPAPILAIALLAATQCINGSVIRDGIIGTDGVKPYNILILFFSLAYMAISLDITGILEAAAYWVTNKGGKDGHRLYLYFYAMITLISIIFGNDPVILSGTVFLVYFTTAIQVDSHAWLISEFAAANTASMVLFVGNPTNVVICEGFGINNAVFSAYTILPFLACSISCYFVLRFQFQSHIPKVLTDLEGVVRAIDVLQDPVGAVVGGVLLGGCLVTALVASFFGVDVWIITLPFAVAKLLFDLSWDFWRFWYREHHINPPMQIQMETLHVPSPEREDTPGEPSQHSPHIPEVAESELSEGQVLVSPSHLANILEVAPLAKQDSLKEVELDISAPDQECHHERTTSPQQFKFIFSSTKLWMQDHFPTLTAVLPRLPLALVPFAFSQFILIEALDHQGWITIFAGWFSTASKHQIHPTIWLIGVLCIILCNLSGTNIGATILLTKVLQAAGLPRDTARAGAIALAMASNIGAVSFTFSASLAGLLWQNILQEKRVLISQWTFAKWNLLPVVTMMCLGLTVTSVEIIVLSKIGR